MPSRWGDMCAQSWDDIEGIRNDFTEARSVTRAGMHWSPWWPRPRIDRSYVLPSISLKPLTCVVKHATSFVLTWKQSSFTSVIKGSHGKKKMELLSGAACAQAASKPLPFFVCKWGGSRFQAAPKSCKWKQLGSSSCKWKQLGSSSHEMGAAWKQLGSGFHTEMGAASKPLPGLLEPLSFWERYWRLITWSHLGTLLQVANMRLDLIHVQL